MGRRPGDAAGLRAQREQQGQSQYGRDAELGPWTRATSQWTADSKDRTRYAAVGASFEVVPAWTVSASYTQSIGDLDIVYSGFGVTFDGSRLPTDHPFAFSTPPTVRSRSYIGDLRFDLQLMRHVALQLGYAYDQYRIDDWQQGNAAPWVEQVGSELFRRDTSRSHQWGNRLFNMGTLKAPGYVAHSAYASFTYQF